MGKVNVQSQPLSSSSPLTHFSHPHPLHPSPIHNPQASTCSACGLPQAQSPSYTCHTCSFTLHHSCAQLPKLITHASHGGCTMALLTKPIYEGAAFSCDACGDKGFAWSYHCERCTFDLHVTCAVKPLKIRHQTHASCELHLTFKSPYAGSEEFRCDMCQRIGSKQWLYRCNSCGFDAHMECTSRVHHHHHQSPHFTHSASAGSVNYIHPQQQQQQQHHMLMHSVSTGAINNNNNNNMAQPYNTMMPSVNNPPPGGVVMGSRPVMMNQYGPPPQMNQYGPNTNTNNNGLGSNLMATAVDGLVNGVFQGIGQTMAQDIMGGGGGGGGGEAGDGSGGDASAY